MRARAPTVVALAACVAACSTAPGRERAPRQPRVPLRPGYIPFVDAAQAKPRPRIDVATVAAATDRDRPWPLSELPSLQPHHDFAMARDLCTGEWAQRNARNAELVAYGAAWCRIQAGDEEGLVPLAKLARTTTGDVQRAARLDVVNLVARADAKRALERLTALQLDAAAELDLLAATYGALDMHEDAVLVAERAWNVARNVSPVEYCERVLAWATLDDNALVRLGGTLVRVGEISDEGRCGKRARATACAIDAATFTSPSSRLAVVRECFNEFPDDAEADQRAWLLVAFFGWSAARQPAEWLALSRQAVNALGLAGAEELAVTALDNAVLASSCESELLREVAAAAYRIANHDLHAAPFEARLEALRGLSVKRCTELHE